MTTTRRDALFASRLEEKSRLDDSPAARQAPRIHLILGPVGAGKSTFARELAQEQAAVRFALDEWMARLFGPDRPDRGVMDWYVERAARCTEQIWSVAKAVAENGTEVVLELGLLQRSKRRVFYEGVDEAGFAMTLHVLDASRDVRRERVRQRNHAKGETFTMVVPPEIFELASDLWEPLETAECEGRDVRFLRTDEA